MVVVFSLQCGAAQVAEVLHQTMEQLSATQALVSQRQPVLDAISCLDDTLGEIDWMHTWKQDANRFSVHALHHDYCMHVTV